MVERLAIVVALIGWFVAVRSAVYYYAIPHIFYAGRPRSSSGDAFDWWWSWLLAIPLTVLTLLVSGLMILFVVYGLP